MKKFLLTAILFILIAGARAQNSKPIVIGSSIELESRILSENRIINIYLPENYNPADTVKYPVIYIPDGGIEEDFFHITGIVRFNTQPWINRFPPSIVIGIENINRRKDFTYSVPDLSFLGKMGFKEEQFPAYGGSANYISFLEKELQPFIESRFKTNGTKTIIGESLAGLLVTEILLKHPELFSTFVIITPSLWWGDGSLLKDAPGLLNNVVNMNKNVYIGACNKKEDKRMYKDAVALAGILKKYGGGNLNLHYDYLPSETHGTVFHQAVYNAFKLIYPLHGNP